jgi:hypothetical protein
MPVELAKKLKHIGFLWDAVRPTLKQRDDARKAWKQSSADSLSSSS